MWILNFTPDWVWHTLFFGSLIGTIIGFVLGMIPIVKRYIIPIRVISLIVLVFSTFMEGALHDYKVWEDRVKEVEAKLSKAEEESKRLNDELSKKEEVVIEKTKIKTQKVKEYITREVKVYDNQCVIPKEFIKAHNDAAERTK